MDGSNFMAKRIDPLLRMTLTDLARTLAHYAKLEVDFAYHSYFDFANERMTISFYWDRLNDERKVDGMKTDVYLRAFGQVAFTNPQALNSCIDKVSEFTYSSFMKQLTALFEEFRVMELCCQYRPGMIPPFQNRKELLIHRYRERYQYHLNRKQWLDALFCAFFLRLAGRPVGLTDELSHFSDAIRQMTSDLQTLKSTDEVVQLVETFVLMLPDTLIDMAASYFTLRGTTGKIHAKKPIY